MDVGFSQTNLNTVDSGNPLTLHYSRLNIQAAQSNPYHLQISWLQMHFSKTWKRAAKRQSTACASPTPSPPCFPANTLTMPTSTFSEPSFVSSSIGPSGAACELSFYFHSPVFDSPTSHLTYPQLRQQRGPADGCCSGNHARAGVSALPELL